MKLNEILTISKSLAQHQNGSNFSVEQAVSDLEEGIHGADFSINQESEKGSDLTAARVPTHSTKLTLDFFREIVAILIICYPDLFMMLIYGLEEGWNYGAIFLPVVYIAFLVMLYQKAKVSKILSEGIHVGVLRDGLVQYIPICQVVVGDVLSLKTGDRVPADGLFIGGSSSQKLDGDDNELPAERGQFPMIFAGATVVEGSCFMRVTAVGENTRHNEMMRSTGSCNINHKSQLHIKVDRLNSNKKKVVMAFSFVIFVVMLLYYYFEGNSASENGGNNDGHVPKGKKATMAELLREANRIIKKQGRATNRVFGYFYLVHVLISGGLKTGVLISLLCAKIKMELAGHRILNLDACATIGCIDTVCICTSKTGGLNLKKEEMADLRKIVDDIKLVVSDDLNTGRFIAINSGIIGPEENLDYAVVEEAEFPNLSDKELENRVVHSRLMVNATPSDTLIVQALKRKCKEVAVASNSTRDSPSLKEAAIGLFMDNGTAQVPQEGTDIVLSDNSLTAIADVLKQGRFSFIYIQKFIQLHLTITIAGLFISFLAATTGKIFLSQFQIWWVSLMGDTLGAFALSTDPPNSAPRPSPPSLGASSLITNTMWRNIVFQALYQAIMSLALSFIATTFIHVDKIKVSAMIFNSYALSQVFVLLNAREIEKKNVFENMHKNLWFLLVVVFMVVLQVTFTCFNPKMSLDLRKWTICTGFSALSLPIGWLVKYIPVIAFA